MLNVAVKQRCYEQVLGQISLTSFEGEAAINTSSSSKYQINRIYFEFSPAGTEIIR